MIDMQTEELLTLEQARRLFPRPPHPSTLWRWVLEGVRGAKLETLVAGGRRYTSREAIGRFVVRTTRLSGTEAPLSSSRRRARERAERILREERI